MESDNSLEVRTQPSFSSQVKWQIYHICCSDERCKQSCLHKCLNQSNKKMGIPKCLCTFYMASSGTIKPILESWRDCLEIIKHKSCSMFFVIERIDIS